MEVKVPLTKYVGCLRDQTTLNSQIEKTVVNSLRTVTARLISVEKEKG